MSAYYRSSPFIELQTLRHTDYVGAVAFSSDGKYLATSGSFDRTVSSGRSRTAQDCGATGKTSAGTAGRAFAPHR